MKNVTLIFKDKRRREMCDLHDGNAHSGNSIAQFCAGSAGLGKLGSRLVCGLLAMGLLVWAGSVFADLWSSEIDKTGEWYYVLDPSYPGEGCLEGSATIVSYEGGGENGTITIPSVLETEEPRKIRAVVETLKIQACPVVSANSVVITNVVFPATLKGIRKMYMLGSNLEEINLPDSLEYILEFGGNDRLKSITHKGNSLRALGSQVFTQSRALERVSLNGDGSLIIPTLAFWGCPSLTTVRLGNGVREISEGAFKECPRLMEFDWGGVESIGSFAFEESCSMPIAFDFTGTKVTNIGVCAFMNAGIGSVTFKDDMILGQEAFSGCTNLSGKVKLPSRQKEILSGVFKNCNKLAAVEFPEGLKSIGGEAFYGCSCLAAFDIPNTVTNIGAQAFYRVDVSQIHVPDSVQSIDWNAFAGCENLERVTVGKGIRQIGNFAFSGCTKLKDVTIECETSTTIGWQAFSSGVEHITFGRGLEELGRYSLSGCPNLKTVTFLGNAPEADYLELSTKDFVVRVKVGTVGWKDETSTDLPEKWMGLRIEFLPIEMRFDANGGSLSETKREYVPRSEYGSFPMPTRPGYSFAGWFTAAEGGQFVQITSIVPDEPITLYAHWTEGTEKVVLIDDATDLVRLQQWISEGTNTFGMIFRQTADIDLGDRVWEGIGARGQKDNVDKEFFSILAFRGTYDGQGKTIKNLKLKGGDYCGFFNSIDQATVRNLKISIRENGVDGPSGNTMGLFVGVAKESTLSGLENIRGAESGSTEFYSGKDASGIVGFMSGGLVEDCINNLDIRFGTAGSRKGAGVVLIAQGGTGKATISRCVNNGRVHSDTAAGGIAGILGYCDMDAVIEDCENAGAVETQSGARPYSVCGNHIGGELTVIGVNKARDSLLAINTACDGLNFAKVSDGVASFVRDADVAAANAVVDATYKVTSPIAAFAYQFVGSGEIAFLTELNAPVLTVTDGNGAAVQGQMIEGGVKYVVASPADPVSKPGSVIFLR